MTKPVLTSFAQIAPLLIQSYERYLPTAFDDSMTMLQKVNKIEEHLNSVGKLSNDVIVQWNLVSEWVMNEGLTESVVEKLNGMIDDGTFESILSAEMLADFNARVINCKSVNDMKAKNNLKVNDLVKTFGFYSLSDGGGAEYTVIPHSGIAGDDIVTFDLSNGLQSKLVTLGSVDASQIGLKRNTDFNNTPNVVSAGKYGIKDIHFEQGVYQFDELLLSSNIINNLDIRLHGVTPLSYNEGGIKATVFSPYRVGQKFIVKVGGYADFHAPATGVEAETYNSSLLNIAFTDTGKPTTNANLCLEYAYSGVFSIAFFDNQSRGLYVKNVWELDFQKLIFRNTTPNVSAMYIDTPLSDGSNTSSCVIKELYLEGINGTFLETSLNPILGNFTIESIMYELSKPFYTVAIQNIVDESTFKGLVKQPLFILGNVDGLMIGKINISGASKYGYTDGVKTFTDSLFKFNGFYNVSIGNINYNDSSAYVQLTEGDGANYSILKIGAVTSSMDNRSANDVTKTLNLLMFSDVKNGLVLIDSNSFKLNHSTQIAQIGKVYTDEDLMLLCSTLYGNAGTVFDADSINGYVFKRLQPNFQSIFTMKYTNHLRVTMRAKTDSSVIQVSYRDSANGVVATDSINIIPDASKYQEFTLAIKKHPTATSFVIVIPTTATTLLIDSLYVDNHTPKIQSGRYQVVDAGTYYTVNFPDTFKNTPTVFVNAEGTQQVDLITSGVSATGFQVFSNVANRSIQWVAFEG